MKRLLSAGFVMPVSLCLAACSGGTAESKSELAVFIGESAGFRSDAEGNVAIPGDMVYVKKTQDFPHGFWKTAPVVCGELALVAGVVAVTLLIDHHHDAKDSGLSRAADDFAWDTVAHAVPRVVKSASASDSSSVIPRFTASYERGWLISDTPLDAKLSLAALKPIPAQRLTSLPESVKRIDMNLLMPAAGWHILKAGSSLPAGFEPVDDNFLNTYGLSSGNGSRGFERDRRGARFLKRPSSRRFGGLIRSQKIPRRSGRGIFSEAFPFSVSSVRRVCCPRRIRRRAVRRRYL